MSARDRYVPWWREPGQLQREQFRAYEDGLQTASRNRAFRFWSWRAMVARAEPDVWYAIMNDGSPIPQYFDQHQYAVAWLPPAWSNIVFRSPGPEQ